jgi:hypothetical protein
MTSAASLTALSTMAPPAPSEAATTLSAPAALSMLPASTSLLSPRLAELLQSPAWTGYSTPLPFAAIWMASFGFYTLPPLAHAMATMPPSAAATMPPSAPPTDPLVLGFPCPLSFLTGGTSPSLEASLGDLASLTTGYGAHGPLSAYSAYVPSASMGRPPAEGPLRSPPAEGPISPLHITSPMAYPGASPYDLSAAPASSSTALVHFSHNLPVKLTLDNYLFWHAQVVPLLHSHSLEFFVDGSCPCPHPAHPSYRLWIAQD